MSEILRITKVTIIDKDNEKSVTIAYSRPPEDERDTPEKHWDTDEITRTQPPLPSFKEALASLAEDVISLCEEQPEVKDRIEVRTVNFKYPKGIMSANITALKWLEESNGMVLLNTPNKHSENLVDNGDEKNVFDHETVIRLDRVIEEAKRYVNGERGERLKTQPGLFDEADEADDENVLRVLPDLLTEICETCAPELLAENKAKSTKIEGVPYVTTHTTGNATDGWEEARVWRIVKKTDFDGDTFGFQELPPGNGYKGLEVSINGRRWILTGEEIVVKAEEAAAVPADDDADAQWENELPVRTEEPFQIPAEVSELVTA